VKSFKFTETGDLQVPELNGEVSKVIELPFYRPASITEVIEKEDERRGQLIAVEREYDETAQLLRDSIIAWRETGLASDVLKYQRDMARLDAQRTLLRSPLRWVQTFKNLSTRDVLVDEFYEVRKLGYPVMALNMRSISFEEYVKIGDGPVKEDSISSSASASASATAAAPEEEESFIIFYNPETQHGELSLETMVDFVYNSTKYNSIAQAYEVERLTLLGRKDLRPLLLRSRNPKQIRTLGTKVVGVIEDAKGLLINILKSLISQHPKYVSVLRETGTDTLVYADPADTLLGVGMSSDDTEITNRKSWKGKNIYGQAWEAVRDSLAEDESASASEDESEVESEPVQKGGGYEQAKKRQGILAGIYKRKFT